MWYETEASGRGSTGDCGDRWLCSQLTDKPFALNLWVPKRHLRVRSEAQIERSLAQLDPYYRPLPVRK